ncbi:MAG TPA: guanylate kinase [Actinomycetota bacterium]|nr:guanylate kinase [Actinomycetota bacterium]
MREGVISIPDSRLFIISGPSGAGKGTIVQRILEERPNTRISVSCTTRPARPMEKEGVHYFFISEREFIERRDRGEFLEWAQVHGNLYGTPRKIVEGLLAEGSDVILEIDVQGASEVKSVMPEARLIFIEAPSMQILEQRLRKRSTEREDVQARRISDAYDELRKKGSFDGVVVNVEVEQAVKEVLALMDSR